MDKEAKKNKDALIKVIPANAEKMKLLLSSMGDDIDDYIKKNKESDLLQSNVNDLEHTLQQHLIRLDEFSHLLQAMSTQKEKVDESILPTLKEQNDELQQLYHRIDTLEEYMNHQEHTIHQLEVRMKQVQDTYGKPLSKQKKFFNSFKSAIFHPNTKTNNPKNKEKLGYVSLSTPCTTMLTDTTKFIKS